VVPLGQTPPSGRGSQNGGAPPQQGWTQYWPAAQEAPLQSPASVVNGESPASLAAKVSSAASLPASGEWVDSLAPQPASAASMCQQARFRNCERSMGRE